MTRPLILILNGDTQEQVTREMNDEEFTQYEIDRVATEARLVEQAEADAAAEAKKAARAEASYHRASCTACIRAYKRTRGDLIASLHAFEKIQKS